VTALTIIMASGATIGAQFHRIPCVHRSSCSRSSRSPLVGYLPMPQKTDALMMRLQDWLRAYGAKLTQAMLVVLGSVGVIQAVASL
jgi:hypothetical protein